MRKVFFLTLLLGVVCRTESAGKKSEAPSSSSSGGESSQVDKLTTAPTPSDALSFQRLKFNKTKEIPINPDTLAIKWGENSEPEIVVIKRKTGEGYIEFYKSRKIIKLEKNRRSLAGRSSRSDVFAIMELRPTGNTADSQPTATFVELKVLDQNGDEIASLSPPPGKKVYLSSGSKKFVVVKSRVDDLGDPSPGPLLFYHGNRLSREVSALDYGGQKLITDLTVSPDGRYVAGSDNSRVVIWNFDGDIVWKFEKEGLNPFGRVAFSENSHFAAITAASGDGQFILVFDENGKLLLNQPVTKAHKLGFSKDQSFLFAWTRNSLTVIRLDDGSAMLAWKEEFPFENQIGFVEYIPNNEIFIVKTGIFSGDARNRIETPVLRFYDLSGRLIETKTFPPSEKLGPIEIDKTGNLMWRRGLSRNGDDSVKSWIEVGPMERN
jgi:WD40 repeat protein